MSIPSRDYLILVQQFFRCKGVDDYLCPLIGRNFDKSGYHIVGDNALCPSCYAVHKQQRHSNIPNTIVAKQRIIHFLHSRNWMVGNGSHRLSFADFWSEFYHWSEEQRLYTKKSTIREIITSLCGVARDSQYLPISPT